MQLVSVCWYLGKVLVSIARGPEFESSVGFENFPGKQMCEQYNMTLVSNLVVHKIQSKFNIYTYIYIYIYISVITM